MPPRNLWIGRDDSVSHYYRWIWEYLAYLTLLCDLRRDSAVLELGCGHGRTARGLLDYLRSPGRYCGLDVDSVRVADAEERIARCHPGFEFLWADVFNQGYNPSGQISAAKFVFPLPDAGFDVCYSASLFTHLLPDEVRNYFSESRRVLKLGGRCLFSFFLLDHYRGPGTTVSRDYEFTHALQGHEGVAVRDLTQPDALVAYSVEVVRAMAQEVGLRVVQVFPGLWSESPGIAVNEQDLLLLARER